MAKPGPNFHPEDAILEIADFIGDSVEPAQFPEYKLRFRNDRAAASIGLDSISDSNWIDLFGRFSNTWRITPRISDTSPGPLALRYHGHQFRVYNSELGDGRGFLYAQCRDDRARLMDLGTKGSGQTPWSRFGDGRLTLKGAVREILATEMLEALGVDTSRTLSVIETGEQLYRGDEPSPTRSAVLVRLSHGHIRIGSFQRLAALGEIDHLRRLVDYALRHYYGDDSGDPVRLLALVTQVCARLAASYMAAGFVHGVLNTDNINISGESFDYGPWRFAPSYDPRFTAAYFDEAGLYAFGRQAEAIHWNLIQLGIALQPLAEAEVLAAALAPFAQHYRTSLIDRVLYRLGLIPRGEQDDTQLVVAMEKALTETQHSIDDLFFDWAGAQLRRDNPAYNTPAFAPFRNAIALYRAAIDLDHPYWQSPGPCSMLIGEVEALWAPIAEKDDWRDLNDKVRAVRLMGDALATHVG